MEIYFKHNQITDFGKALLETLQQKKYYDPKLLIRVSNFMKSYPAISEQIDAVSYFRIKVEASGSKTLTFS